MNYTKPVVIIDGQKTEKYRVNIKLVGTTTHQYCCKSKQYHQTPQKCHCITQWHPFTPNFVN